MMDNEIDKAFFQSMISDQKASMGGNDKAVFSREKRKPARENQNFKRKKKWEDEPVTTVLLFSVTIPLQISALMTK